MRIAQVAPLYESVPPKTYGGTERVVNNLTETLIELGHDVTLFASGDSITKGELVPGAERSLRLNPDCPDPLIHHYIMLEKVYRMREQFDVVHFHVDYLHFPRTRAENLINVSTLHGKLTIPDLYPLYREFPEMPVISISDSQRAPLPWLNWQATVYHGLPLGLYRASTQPEGYLAFLGRISPEKGVDRAIEIARRSGLPLKIAAKIDKADEEYFNEVVSPLLKENRGRVEFIGEINDREKQDFLGNARALLFPINWPEPFGMVMIEAMACGTPVIAFSQGSVPEIIENGKNGYICESVEEAVRRVSEVHEIDRMGCRKYFETNFSAVRMANDYLRVYKKLIADSTLTTRPPLRVTKPTELYI